MQIFLIILLGWLIMTTIMGALWLWQKPRDNPSVVDPMWAIGLGLLSIFYAVSLPGIFARKIIVTALIVAWSARLSWYLIKRIRRLPEDGRYADMRERFGERAQLFFFGFFQLQAFWSVMFSLPVLIAMLNPKSLMATDFLGIIIWAIAVTGETIADKQLNNFRSNPVNQKKVCNIGLWRYSRHPNYFFEWLHWWCYVAIASYFPWGLLSLAGPVIMLYFLLKVTGVPPTEASSLRSRGDAYRAYQKTTSVFFPWFPKKDN